MIPMERYLVFYFEDYYPAGGWNDFKQSFDTLEEAIAYARAEVRKSRLTSPGHQIIDLATGEEVSFDLGPVPEPAARAPSNLRKLELFEPYCGWCCVDQWGRGHCQCGLTHDVRKASGWTLNGEPK